MWYSPTWYLTNNGAGPGRPVLCLLLHPHPHHSIYRLPVGFPAVDLSETGKKTETPGCVISVQSYLCTVPGMLFWCVLSVLVIITQKLTSMFALRCVKRHYQ